MVVFHTVWVVQCGASRLDAEVVLGLQKLSSSGSVLDVDVLALVLLLLWKVLLRGLIRWLQPLFAAAEMVERSRRRRWPGRLA